MATSTRIRAALALAALLLASGCGTAKRFITVTHWHGADTLYMAYSEDDGGYAAKVLKCHREADNALKCGEQQTVGAVINGD